MSFPGRPSLHGWLMVVLVLAFIGLLICSPTGATLIITGTVFSPDPPLTAGSVQSAVSSVTLIPSGATTFSRYHSLQLQTGLLEARWEIQVMVNGIPAAQQIASGTTAFVNGYLLSYPTTSDLSFTVMVNGTVPSGTGTNVTLIQVIELDNGGAPVPGSSITVSAPLTTSLTAVPGYPPMTAPHVSLPEPAALQQTAHMPGFSAAAGIVGLVMCVLAGVTLRWQRHR